MSEWMRMGWIRHGRTSWNEAGKIQGVTDVPLNDAGVQQARRLADWLAKEMPEWDGVAASDLRRAHETGRILAERLQLPLFTDARLRERSFGSAEGTTEPERLRRWGPDWRRRIPDQEPDESVRRRALDFVGEFARTHAGERWLVVTHGSFLVQLFQALDTGLDDRYIGNMSLTILELREGRWHPLVHNATAHLADPARSNE
jgi:probable phosphoglycerate mutase